MSETVRDAVFGNVGSMISFRVSADDAPILGKQFEPQFEPGDLLQMHNRHFIINMVINGEKTPAFSATTLALPPEQVNNSPLIIENSRRLYSRTRAEVEAEISATMNSGQPAAQSQGPATTQAPKAPSTQAQAKLWPVDAGARAVELIVDTPEGVVSKSQTSMQNASAAPSQAPGGAIGTGDVATTTSAAPAKRKRKRTRKRKPAAAPEA